MTTKRKLLTAVVSAALSAPMIPLTSTAVEAACGDRPGTPVWRPPSWASNNSIHLTWINKATEMVWWDLEISNEARKVLSSQAGIQPIGTHFNQILTLDLGVPPGAQRCYRLRARTAPGTEGCVSNSFSSPICTTDAGPRQHPSFSPTTPPEAPGTGPCGPRWFRGGDGKCHPQLN
jgi:hypothetical protein